MSGWDSMESYYPNLFQEVLLCVPFDAYKNPELETGNKVVMPSTCLSRLKNLGVSFPWFFKIETFTSDKSSHCGVLEFCAEEGFIYMPRWMMANLKIEEGEEVLLREARPPMGTRMMLQPHTTAFVEVANVRAVLETAMRGFSCLSKGDTIVIRYGEKEFFIDVLDVGPGGEVISLIDTDCVVEFAPPLDYVEAPPREVAEEGEGVREFRPFTGTGMRLDGKARARDAVVKEEGKGGEGDSGLIKVEEDKVNGGVIRGFRAFSGVARRMDGGRCAVAGGEERAEAEADKEEEEKREKDGGKDEGKEKFKPFAGRGRVLGGPFFDN